MTNAPPPPPPPYSPPPPPLPYGHAPQGAPQYQQGYYGPATRQHTNGLAIASMVLGILWLYWVGSVLAIIFAFIARKQIRDSHGAQGGDGMAIAGMVLGFIGAGTFIIVMIVIAAASNSPSYS